MYDPNNCLLDFKFNSYDFNSLSPFCKNYIMNQNKMNENINTISYNSKWSDESSSIAMWIMMLFIPFIGYVINKSVDFLKDEIENENTQVPYEYKYVDEFEELLDKKNKTLKDEDEGCDENDEDYETEEEYEVEKESESETEVETEDKKEYAKMFIEEETPRGKVGLRYSPYTESFWWWSNTKDIPFKYLETVSRRYVIENDCLDIYVDIRDELQKGVEKANETKKKDELKEKQEQNIQRVYAKFRKYNQKASRILGGSTAYPVLKEKCNRYTYKGNYKDYLNAKEAGLPDNVVQTDLEKVLKTKAKQEDLEQEIPTKLTFTEWKKINELKERKLSKNLDN